MIKTVLFFVIALIVYWVLSQPSQLAEAKLLSYDASLPSLQEQKRVGGSCIYDKCLTIYLAPWCRVCRQAHSMIEELASELKSEGIRTQIVLGMDANDKLIEYANTFSSQVYLDPDNIFFEKLDDAKGVPYFVVSDWKGDILEDMSGAHLQVGAMKQRLKL